MSEMMKRRRALMGVKNGGGGLPAEYQQCEWITSSSYIKTNIVIANNYPTIFNVKCYPTAFGMYGANVMCIGTAETNPILAINVRTGITIRSSGADYSVISATTKNKIVEISATVVSDKVSVSASIDGTLYSGEASTGQYTWNSTNSALYFWNRASNAKMTGRIYSASVIQQGVVIANFVPCYRKADDIIGLYDLIGRSFYETTGSKGADVT